MRADQAGFFILNPKSYNDLERQPARFRSLMDGPRSGRKREVDMHPKKVTVLKVTGVELVTLSYF